MDIIETLFKNYTTISKLYFKFDIRVLKMLEAINNNQEENDNQII